MPTLGAPLDCAKLEIRNERVHNLGTAPVAGLVEGLIYYDTAAHLIYFYNGTIWIAAGAADATLTSKGIIKLAGDLAGTADLPQIAAGVIVLADCASSLIDQVAGTASLRTLAVGAAATNQAMPGDVRLNQIRTPIADIDMGAQRITNMQAPNATTDAANKQYVDTLIQGLDSHPSVRAATTANITLSGTQTVDGIALIATERCLVKDQTLPQNNGIYVVAAGAWTRAVDQDAAAEFPSAYVWVEQGTVNADTGWTCTVDQGFAFGSAAIPWVLFSSAGTLIAGAGLTKTGNTFDVGAGAGITVNADTIQVANNGITNAMIADGAIDIGAASLDTTGTLPVAKGGTGYTTPSNAREVGLGATGYYTALNPAGSSWTITAATHGLQGTAGRSYTCGLIVQCQVEATGAVILPDITVNGANGNVTITFGVSQTANTIRTTIIG